MDFIDRLLLDSSTSSPAKSIKISNNLTSDIRLVTFAVLQVPVRVPAAAALWAGPQLGVEGGEGGGRLLARAGRLPHRGVEGRVVQD